MKFTGLVLLFIGAFSSVTWADSVAPGVAMPLTTKSNKVRALVELAYKLDADTVQQDKAIAVMRKVVKLDPNFAMGHQILAQISLDPREQVEQQQKAFATRKHASPAEQTVIDWFENAADHKLIPAIMNMNEVLRQYPHDRWLVFLANFWLMSQTQYERAAEVYESSGISDSPGLINNAAYTYANMRKFDKAFRLMDKYVALLPAEPNPQDSYAELLRMAGRYDEALKHYQAALAISPRFYSSQFGIADTYFLMGEEPRARRAYDTTFANFPAIPILSQIQWRTNEASTYLREGDFEGARRAFQTIADGAHRQGMSQVEADIYRQMAIFEPQPEQALALLNKADTALHVRTHASPTSIQQEAAEILRTRIEVGLKTGDKQTADRALASLASLSEGSSDKVIESSYQGAAGACLFFAHMYKQSIPHLEEDADNPWSLKRLVVACRRTKDVVRAKRAEDILANYNTPGVDQALVVPPFRKSLETPLTNGKVKRASLQP
ncbi:MAG: tetratricopeptide repeat protein [Acidobacteria bacterium]|nr:tetratricopeptide repeat protein [Acidobacteriota bacterium]